MDGIPPNWTSLPQHLLALIAKFLRTRIDIRRFRAVCSLFRSAIPPPPQVLFPNSILTTTDFLKGPNPLFICPFDLVEYTTYAIEPLNRTTKANRRKTSPTWLIEVQELEPGKVRVTDSLSGFYPRKLPKPLNLLDYRVTEINKSYFLQSTGSLRLFFSSFPDESNDEFAVMTIYNCGRNLGIWRNVDRKWSNIDMMKLQSDHSFEDFIFHNQKFYVLFSTCRLVTVDPKSLNVTQVASRLWLLGDNLVLYLVRSFKDLLLLQHYNRYYGSQDCIKIYKLDEEKRTWVQVKDAVEFEDRAFFLADSDGAYSVSATEFPGCRGCSVYFPISTYHSGKCEYSRGNTWICDLKDGEVEKGIAGKDISDFPGYFDLFWPPPAWLD